MYADSLANSNIETDLSSSTSEDKEIPIDENLMTGVSLAGRGFSSADSIHELVDAKSSQSDAFHQEIDVAKNKQNEKEHPNLSLSKSVNDQSHLLEHELGVRRALSEGPLPVVPSLSDTLDAKWTGENQSGIGIQKDNTSGNPDMSIADALTTTTQRETYYLGDRSEDQNSSKSIFSSLKSHDNLEDSLSWLGMPFVNFYRQFNKSLFASSQKIEKLVEYNPVFVTSFGKLGLHGGASMLLPIGVNDTVIPIYDDEPSSIIAHALMSSQYHSQLSDELERSKDGSELASTYFSESGAFQSFSSADDTAFDSQKSFGSIEDMILSMSGSRNSSMLDPVMYTKAMHAKVSFGEEDPLAKVKYYVTVYYAKRFEALRRVCCPSELDYIRSLSRCKKWRAQGGKSNVFFAKTLDDRFIIKQVTKTELESFVKFGPEYFKYLSESIGTGSPTCLAKILGIYQVLVFSCLTFFLLFLFLEPQMLK